MAIKVTFDEEAFTTKVLMLKGEKGEVGSGNPVAVGTVAEMTDTTEIYLYTGSESGYTKGDWYYYDGTAWVSGGKYGADGGINSNARNILKYILQRVAYTETGMQTYVDALYQALAQAGGGGDTPSVTTYMIMNMLTHVTNSNDAAGADEGDSYTATLTADTDYHLTSVTVMMGGVDITSTAYTSVTREINIASVTGDIVITASATDIVPAYYTLDSTEFTGSNYVNTGVNLHGLIYAGSASLFVDFTDGTPINNEGRVVWDMDASPYWGINITGLKNSLYNISPTKGETANKTNITGTSTGAGQNIKVVVVYQMSDTTCNYSIYASVNGVMAYTRTGSQTSFSVGSEGPLLVGVQATAQLSSLRNYWVGTVNRLNIYDTALEESDIKKLLEVSTLIP